MQLGCKHQIPIRTYLYVVWVEKTNVFIVFGLTGQNTWMLLIYILLCIKLATEYAPLWRVVSPTSNIQNNNNNNHNW